jgi:hypothetical protein
MSDSLRSDIAAVIKPHLPARWRFIPNQQTPERISVVTVVLKHLEINPLENLPIDHAASTVVLTVLNPNEDDVKAENALDDDVLTLFHAIRPAADWLRIDSAKKVRDERNNCLGWDFTLTAITITTKE